MGQSHPFSEPLYHLLSLIFLIPACLNVFNQTDTLYDPPRLAVISFAGDCTLGSSIKDQGYARGFIVQMQDRGFDYPFSGVRDIFEADDLTLVNLEGTFTHSKKAMDKSFVFRAPPNYAEILRLGSVEAVNIANNHINDYGRDGKKDTIAALDQYGVRHSGNGELAIYEAGGIRIGMTGYSYPHKKTLQYLARDIPILRAFGCDIIILSMHAGTEEQYKANGAQINIARGAIDLGVDIVVGHHPHVLQNVEVYKGKPIFYSLGNFSFGGNINPKDWDTMIAQVVVQKDAEGARLIEMRLIPCRISEETHYSDYRPVPATEERAQTIFMKLKRYSPSIDPVIFETGVLPLE